MTWSDDLVIATALAAAISALAAAIAAVANWRQSRHAAHANSVNVYLEMMKDFTSPAMRAAISDLAAFWEKNRRSYPGVTEAYRDLTTHNPAAAAELLGKSRTLSHYFMTAAKLHEAKIISEQFLTLLVDQPALNVFYVVAVPINMVHNAHHSSEKYANQLKQVVAQHGAGFYNRDV